VLCNWAPISGDMRARMRESLNDGVDKDVKGRIKSTSLMTTITVDNDLLNSEPKK